MKALNKKTKITYSPDVDILMIQLSDKKIDDSYDADQMIIQVDKEGEPVLIEIFNGLEYLKDLSKTLPRNIQKELWPQSVSVAHRLR